MFYYNVIGPAVFFSICPRIAVNVFLQSGVRNLIRIFPLIAECGLIVFDTFQIIKIYRVCVIFIQRFFLFLQCLFYLGLSVDTNLNVFSRFTIFHFVAVILPKFRHKDIRCTILCQSPVYDFRLFRCPIISDGPVSILGSVL